MSALARAPNPPSGPVVISMRWHDLLFAHWPMPAAALRSRIPAGLELDTFDGTAWLGIVALRMSHVHPLRLPLPGDRFRFRQLNVRTYVTGGGSRGVWFFSLDVSDPPSVWLGRLGFHLPYQHSRASLVPDGDALRFESRRRKGGPAEYRVRYRPLGEPATPDPGTLDAFLTDRLSLFSADRSGRLRRADMEHRPWALQPAEVQIERNTMAEANDLSVPDTPPRFLYAREIDVLGRGATQPFG